MGLGTGIHKITDDMYHADPCPEPSLSRGTIADLINCTPAHARAYHPRLNPDYVSEEKDIFDLGKVAHALFLEGLDTCEVCDFPTWQSGKAKEAKEAARIAGKTPLLVHQYDRVQAMVNAANIQLAESELGIKDLLTEGDAELTYIWQENGIYCRVRPDWVSHKEIGGKKLIIDYKTCGESANPDAFIRKALSMGYDIQHHFYRRGVQAIEGGKMPRLIFVAQETYAPYLCSFIGLDPATMEMGKQKTEYGMFMWGKCLQSNEWPGYPKRICYVETPPWAMAQWEAKAQEMGVE